jgi:ABC-type transport system involved in cytochrome c biogenesis ATPase subunit
MNVGRKLQTKRVDEDAIRKAFLSGQYPGVIANAHGNEDRGRVAELLLSNRDRWLAEEPFDPVLSDDRRIFRRKMINHDFGYRVIHIPLPRVSMHVAALECRP